MAEPGLYIGKTAATFKHDGEDVFIGPRTIVRAGHPIMKGREDLFEPLVVHYDLPAAEDAPEPKAPARTPSAAAKKPGAGQ